MQTLGGASSAQEACGIPSDKRSQSKSSYQGIWQLSSCTFLSLGIQQRCKVQDNASTLNASWGHATLIARARPRSQHHTRLLSTRLCNCLQEMQAQKSNSHGTQLKRLPRWRWNLRQCQSCCFSILSAWRCCVQAPRLLGMPWWTSPTQSQLDQAAFVYNPAKRYPLTLPKPPLDIVLLMEAVPAPPCSHI